MRGTMELESVVISGSTPGGSTFASILRVDSSRSGRSSGSGGSTGSMEEGRGSWQRWKERYESNSDYWRQVVEEGG